MALKMADEYHIPVMVAEVLEALRVEPNGLYVDCTVGGGGHAQAVLEQGGRLIGIDRDPEAAVYASKRLSRFASKFELHNARFSQLAGIVGGYAGEIDGVLMDLGVSSRMLDDSSRGFSYMHEGPLTMTMGCGSVTAYDVLALKSEGELADIFSSYGEERFSRKIAEAIVKRRARKPLETTTELGDLIEKTVGGRMPQKSKARIFQALRIYVNDELNELKTGLECALNVLKPRGRLCVIAYHSLEDRIVKDFMRTNAEPCICPPGMPVCRCGPQRLKLITRKLLIPSPEEQAENIRSRSAKLRAAEKKGEA